MIIFLIMINRIQADLPLKIMYISKNMTYNDKLINLFSVLICL